MCDEIVDADTVSGRRFIHASCERKLLRVSGAVCMHCGAPLEFSRVEYCMDCARKVYTQDGIHGEKSFFKQGKALYVYKGEIKKTMYRFKYSNKREYADFFASEVVDKYSSWIRQNKIQAIVAVPMYRKKQKLRGYNQAEVFGRALAKKLDIPYIVDGIQRIVDTAPMKGLDDVERKNNLKNAFQCSENIVQYDYILLVDDIYTTGSTADAVAGVMVGKGVSNVFLLSICIGQGF